MCKGKEATRLSHITVHVVFVLDFHFFLDVITGSFFWTVVHFLLAPACSYYALELQDSNFCQLYRYLYMHQFLVFPTL